MNAFAQSSIVIEPKITVELPVGKVIVDESYLRRLEAKADEHCYWSLADLKERYGHNKDWFVKNVFTPFEKELYDKAVMYPHGGKSTYWCKPGVFGPFMDRRFPQISKQARK
jgi:phage pi2 protein 07